ncbi:hypothetical protein [Streptomyces sp. NPDC058953]|uniref:hypothetical protein n=1 Tax=unclassified Streptomyces TaxID=2593676 RepID=UPI00369DED30
MTTRTPPARIPPSVRRRALSPVLLYGRSRGLPVAFAALAVTLLVTAWAEPRLVREHGVVDPANRLPLTLLAPVVAAAVVGTGLHTPSAELDRAAARPWWWPRLLHVAGATGLAAAGLALALTGSPDVYGSPAAIRNLLGGVGLTLLTAVVAGAGPSWLPTALYSAVAYFVLIPADEAHTGAAGVWGWAVQPGPQTGAWATAVTLFATGTAAWALLGSRRRDG